jgi:hypothetical protein
MSSCWESSSNARTIDVPLVESDAKKEILALNLYITRQLRLQTAHSAVH